MTALEQEYRISYFDDEGFERKQCPTCGDYFWTRDGTRETCGESPCDDYSFIDDPALDREYSLAEMREEFLSFFEDHGHERVDPRPVAAHRWRDDVLLTQASIYDFQPHVTSGRSPPPANPLCVSQPCIRMNDIENVGKTGRHTMAFEMMGHHAFNADEGSGHAYEGEVYWKDECVEYCEAFFEHFGVDLADLTFIEDVWVGGGNAGPCFEVMYRGIELVTLVFMSMEMDDDGEYELKDGNRYAKMDRRVVDTGYGLERWTWVSQGTPTVYDAIYPEMVEFLREDAGIDLSADEAGLAERASKLAGHLDVDEVEDVEAARDNIARELDVETERLVELMEPLEGCYAIADHCRTLAYMLGDEIVPSSADAGYLARMVLRRTERLRDDVGVETPLVDLVDVQAERLGYENRDTIRDMVTTEVEKYHETVERGTRRVRQLAREHAEDDEPIPVGDLVELYDSHGLHPDLVEEVAGEFGVDVEVPDNFWQLVAERHGGGPAFDDEGESSDRYGDLARTERLYYDDQERLSFDATVVDVFERGDEYDVVLDRTAFYPEGGGQPGDRGELRTPETSVSVRDTQSRDGVVFHRTRERIAPGTDVEGRVDERRRRQLMAHHTATHVVGACARRVLGEHVRQAGAQKGTESSRIDLAHYDRISREQAREIERLANDLVTRNVRVEQEWPDRHEAEEKYGFDIYQGGVPAGEDIRLVHVAEDVQACAGTHVRRTGDVGVIKILNVERVQDGVERVTFAAGESALDAIQRQEEHLRQAAETFDVSPAEVPATAERFFAEWKERGKRVEELKEQLAAARASGSAGGEEYDVDGTTVVVQRVDGDVDELAAAAQAIADDGRVAVLGGVAGSATESRDDGAQFAVAAPEDSPFDASDVAGRLAERVGGGAGGSSTFASGGGPDVDELDDALNAVPELLRARV